MLNTPGGKPASSTISAKSAELNGATSLGFSTMVQPTPMAGMTLRVTWFIGQFHGVMSAATPTGSYRIALSGAWSPSGRSNSNALSARMMLLMWPAPAPTCAVDASAIGAPISVEIATAISSLRAL